MDETVLSTIDEAARKLQEGKTVRVRYKLEVPGKGLFYYPTIRPTYDDLTDVSQLQSFLKRTAARNSPISDFQFFVLE